MKWHGDVRQELNEEAVHCLLLCVCMSFIIKEMENSINECGDIEILK